MKGHSRQHVCAWVLGASLVLIIINHFIYNDLLNDTRIKSLPAATQGHQDSGQQGQARVGHQQYRDRRLVKELEDIQRQISRLAGQKAVVDAKWAVGLKAVIADLSPKMAVTNLSTWDFSARLKDMEPAPPSPGRTRHVCPEVYLGPKVDNFRFHGMEAEKCSYVPPFREVLTVVLPAFSWSPNTTTFVISQIRKFYDIPIVVISEAPNITHNMTDVTTVSYNSNGFYDGSVLNKAIKQITTPYVLVGMSLAHFDNQSSLERLVRVLDDLEHVEVAAGAARDLQSHWIHGCLQQRLADYQALYTTGYYYSKYECMYCDDLLTPFITSTKFINSLPFADTLSGPAMYREWFNKVRAAGHMAMVCPDVMFYLTSHVNMIKEDWQKVARLWNIEKVTSYTGHVHSFSCKSVDISCKDPLKRIKSFLLPPCCRAIMEQELDYLLDYGDEHNLHYELHAGSNLGAVKMGGYLPWDYDSDILFEQQKYDQWLKMRKYIKKRKCTLNVVKEKVYFVIKCPYFFLEFYSHGNVTRQWLPAEYRNTPTKILYAGRWRNVVANPGLIARNYIGFEYLKHASHWRTHSTTDIGKAKGGYENPGVWQRCEKPGHHSCYDRYPGDGNLPFLKPFLHP
ncbi:uncharacterized protein LOC121862915 [Homarus americanus]|nr:uncharacterized protein LOC121862915 [Homarus americanus]XP_042217261.1 uncharacterized protein LOC121862915 [Homarus americanus]XP_042217262.1 uncharacterized protein LOC121862915 [Homarus americanus]